MFIVFIVRPALSLVLVLALSGGLVVISLIVRVCRAPDDSTNPSQP
jgi:hypothetical protein